MKRCGICKEVQPLDKFGQNATKKDGLNYACKECSNAKRRKWGEKNPEKEKAMRARCTIQHRLSYDPFKAFVKRLKYKYGLTIEQFDEMMLNQGGMCAICDQEDFLVIDHDHTTGKVRQLLCDPCNRVLGILKDSPDLATKAAEYLKKHKTP